MRLAPALAAGAAATLTGATLPHIGPAWIDAPAACLMLAGLALLTLAARAACKA